MKRANTIQYIVTFIVSIWIGVLASPDVFAKDVDNNLRFSLGSSTIFLPKSRTTGGDTIAIIPFSFWWTQSAPNGTVTTVCTRFTYNSTYLEYITAYKDSTNWAGTLDLSGTQSGTVAMRFPNGTGSAPTSPTTIGYVKFKLKCQPEQQTNTLSFTLDSQYQYVDVGGATKYPQLNGTGCQNGTVVSANYSAAYEVDRTTLTCGVLGEIDSVAVYCDSANFRSQYMQHWFTYDSARLTFWGITPASAYSGLFWNYGGGYNDVEVDASGWLDPYCWSEITSKTVMYYLKFKFKGAWAGDSTELIFSTDTAKTLTIPYANCSSLTYSANPFAYLNGRIVLPPYIDSLNAKVDSATNSNVLYKSVSGGTQYVYYSLQMKNNFPLGKANNRVQTVINLSTSMLNSPTKYDQSSTDSIFAGMDTHTNGTRELMFREYDTSLMANFWPCRGGFKTWVKFRAEFDTSGSGFTPTYNNRWQRLKFLANYTSGSVHDTTKAVDSTGKVIAKLTTSPNKVDTARGDSVQLAVGKLYLTDGISSDYRPFDTLYISSPACSVDSFSTRIVLQNATWCIYSVSKASNVSSRIASGANADTVELYSTTGYSVSAGSGNTFVAKIQWALPRNCTTSQVYYNTASQSNALVRHNSTYSMWLETNDASLQGTCNSKNACLDNPKLSDNDGSVQSTLPQEFTLYDNYPNPFNPETKIAFDIPSLEHVRINIFNMLGQNIITLTDQEYTPGHYVMMWNGKDRFGLPMASGIYLYRMESGAFVESKKMLLLK